MTKMSPIHTYKTVTTDERRKLHVAIGQRASKIVLRLMPLAPTPHGFHQTQDFILACRYRGERDQLYRDVFARLLAKATPSLTGLTAQSLRDPMGRRG